MAGNSERNLREGGFVPGSSLARWSPLTGAVSAALWIAALLVDNKVDSRQSDARIVAFYANKGHRSTAIVTFFLVLAACIFFIWFACVLQGRIVDAGGRATPQATLALASGLVTPTLWVVAAAIWTAIPSTLDIDEAKNFVLDANFYRLLSGLSDLLFFSGSTIALLLVAATSATARRTGLLPQWLAWLGFVVAASMIASFTFVPFLAFLGWLLIVSLILAARRPTAAPPGAA